MLLNNEIGPEQVTVSISESIGLCRANAFAASTWMGEAVRVYIGDRETV